MEKGQIVTIDILDMSNEGKGIGKIEGLAIFVDGVVIGDKITAEITKVKKNYCFAKLVEINNPSIYRVASACEYSKECGGCTLAELSYDAQLAWKEKMILDLSLIHISEPTR